MTTSSEPELETFLPSSSSDPPPSPSSTSTLRLYILCIVNFGISFIWALEFALTTPFFQEGLQSGHKTSHLVWILGPISGLIVAPTVGYYSDKCTSIYGRRRPFILGGSVFAVLGIAIFCNSQYIAKAFFAGKWAIPLAILGFAIMDLSLNTVMWPVRSLQGDLVDDELQHEVQAANVVMGSAGDLVANLLVWHYETPVSHIGSIFGVGMIVYVVSVAVVMVVGKEKRYVHDIARRLPHATEGSREWDEIEQQVDVELEMGMEMSQKTNGSAKFNDVEGQENGIGSHNIASSSDERIMWFGLPRWFWKLGFAYFLCFAAFFAIVPNISSWMGEVVMQGNSDAPKGSPKHALYEKGVSLYGEAGLLRGLVQILFSATYPKLLKRLNGAVGGLLGASFLLGGVVILVLAKTTSPMMGIVVVAFLAILMAALFTLPVAVVVQKAGEEKRGAYLGALNIFAVLPQIMDTAYTGAVSSAFGEDWVMRIGSCWAILAAIASFAFV